MPMEGYSGTVHRKGQPQLWPSASKVIPAMNRRILPQGSMMSSAYSRQSRVLGDIYRLALHQGAQPGLQGVGRDEIHPLAQVILQPRPPWVGTAHIFECVTGTTVAAAAGSA
jgi:hypothetical protein